jgi:hypothetical protein
VSQSNSRFNALEILTVEVHYVRIPIGFGYVKPKGRHIQVMAHLKSIIEIKTETNCLAHTLVIAIAKIKNDPNYGAYRKGWKIPM